MKTILKITALSAILLSLAGICFSCKDKENDKPFETPIDVPFTDYILPSGMPGLCRWVEEQGIDCRINNAKLVIINSIQDMENYITCPGNASYPPIDFSKHTLLLVRDCETNGISITKRLQQLSPNGYKLDIAIHLNDATDVPYWAVALVINKLGKKDKVELNVTTTK